MTGRRVTLKGYRVDKQGRLVKSDRHLDVSTRLKRRGSKAVKVARKGAVR